MLPSGDGFAQWAMACLFPKRTVYILVCTSSVVFDMGDRLATIDMGRKLGRVLFGGGELGPQPHCVKVVQDDVVKIHVGDLIS